MTDLLNIAKECGADETVSFYKSPLGIKALLITEHELHATVDKVCGPLVEALSANPAIHDTERMAYEAVENYKKLMGQDK